MTKVVRLQHRFETSVPHELDPGVLYISLEYTSMIHLCACGCGREVVTPLSPMDWKMSFDGEAVSVSPSIGSWSLPCRSHYFIDRGAIRWANDWTDEEIQKGRELDLKQKRGSGAVQIASKSESQVKLVKGSRIPEIWRKTLRGLRLIP